MKKYLPLLEKNVQWIALGLGALFLLYMVYANVIAPPMHVTVNGESLTPAQVEEYITNNAVNELEQKAKDDPRVVPAELRKKPEFVDVFPKPQPVPQLAATAFPNLAVAVAEKPNPSQPNNPAQPPGANAPGQQVVALPVVPAPTNLRIDARRANAHVAPPAVVDPNNPNPAPAAVEGTDIDYVSVAFDVSVKEIAVKFRETKIPAALLTSFLDVQLIREEKDEQGNWGNEAVVAKLKNSEQPAAPDPKNRNAVQGYIAWAESNQDKVLQPKFYDIVKGDAWVLPGEKPAEAAAQAGQWAPRPANENEIRPGFDPVNPPPDMTNAEKRAKYQYEQEKKRKEQQEKNRNRPQPNPGGRPPGMPGGPGGRGGGGPGGAGGMPGFSADPVSPSSGIVPFQVGMEGPGMPGRPPFPGMPGMPGMPGDFPGMPGMPGANPGSVSSGPVPCPTGSFDPRLLTIDPVTGWAHDETVAPGSTYRYKVRYSIKNPVFGALKIANPPTLADGYQIVSKDSEWTSEVTIPERAYYYVVRTNVTGGNAQFEIYTFGGGKWNVATFTASPGDAIGASKDGIDYGTGYTVVDVRAERNDQVVVLADANGNLKRRSMRADSSDAQREKLKQQMAAGTAPPPGTEAGQPGVPPGMPGGPGMPGMPGMPGFPGGPPGIR